jgi:hypothetical protein
VPRESQSDLVGAIKKMGKQEKMAWEGTIDSPEKASPERNR